MSASVRNCHKKSFHRHHIVGFTPCTDERNEQKVSNISLSTKSNWIDFQQHSEILNNLKINNSGVLLVVIPRTLKHNANIKCTTKKKKHIRTKRVNRTVPVGLLDSFITTRRSQNNMNIVFLFKLLGRKRAQIEMYISLTYGFGIWFDSVQIRGAFNLNG